MQTIKYPAIEHPDDWLKCIAKEFSKSIHNNCLEIPKHLGKGEFRQYYPCEWLTVSYLKISLNEAIEFQRIGMPNRPYIPVVFYLADAKQVVDNKQYQVGMHKPNGIFMPSPDIESKWVIPANESITNLTLAFKKEWLLSQIQDSGAYISQLINNKDSFYVFESITPTLLRTIEKIENEIESNQLCKLSIYSSTIQLFTQFTKQLNNREKLNAKSNITSYDVKKLFEIRQLILDNITDVPLIETLASKVAMSSSKLQKSFKLVFGKSITQYALREKMRMAKDMLSTQSYSVSDVAYKLGYSNVSHFAKAFNKCYQINPGAYLESLACL
ncbi:helix-turn-helix transcriptional regulator [Marinifilum sp.]|uniref:AraC family transcriptional regulator n=1 Tax=Marinifilum sp. TaxID=2033137 RepID=UPI003BAAECD3